MVKVISLSESAYGLLRAHKRKGESFSQVVERLARGRGSLMDIIDEGPIEGAEEYASHVRAVHEELKRRL